MRILNKNKVFFLAFILSLLVTNTFASTLSDQRLMFSAKLANTEYRLPLSAIKKINARNQLEREIQLRGDVLRNTYEFNGQISAKNAWLMTMDALPKNKRVLFSCDGLSCGSSNGWANEIFSIKQLYGLDQSQKFRAYAIENDASSYIAVYFVQRGNKRIYSQIDYISTLDKTQRIAPSASAVMQSLTENGFYSLPILGDSESIRFDPEELKSVLAALKAKPISRYYLVGHSYSEENLADNQERAMSYAKHLLEKIIEKRMSAQRFSPQSVANLAPDQAVPVDRVSIVVNSNGT